MLPRLLVCCFLLLALLGSIGRLQYDDNNSKANRASANSNEMKEQDALLSKYRGKYGKPADPNLDAKKHAMERARSLNKPGGRLHPGFAAGDGRR